MLSNNKKLFFFITFISITNSLICSQFPIERMWEESVRIGTPFHKYFAHTLPNGNVLIKRQEFIAEPRLIRPMFPQKIAYFVISNPSGKTGDKNFPQSWENNSNIKEYNKLEVARTAAQTR